MKRRISSLAMGLFLFSVPMHGFKSKAKAQSFKFSSSKCSFVKSITQNNQCEKVSFLIQNNPTCCCEIVEVEDGISLYIITNYLGNSPRIPSIRAPPIKQSLT